MTDLTLTAMLDEVRRLNTDKGWRTDLLPSPREFSALLHTEIGESTDAYRRWKLDDATVDQVITGTGGDGGPELQTRPGKPEGVGAELADVLIRLLDTVDALGLKFGDTDLALADIAHFHSPDDVITFVDHMDWLHDRTYLLKMHRVPSAAWMLRAIVTTCGTFGIDLAAEYRRKMDHNWTRPLRHGGKAL